MDKEKLALCDRLLELTKRGRLEWTIVSEERFEAEVDELTLVLWLSPFKSLVDGSISYTAYLEVKDGEESFELKEGWKGWKRIFQHHPLAHIARFCRREAKKIRAVEEAQQEAQQNITEENLVAKISSELTQH